MTSYLIAFAAGPWDVVEAAPIAPNAVRRTPLRLRGLAVHGKGTQLDYALRHSGAIVAALQDYFGLPYPFDKLDLIAAPDVGYSAMEDAGLIVPTDTLLLGIDKAPTRTRSAFWAIHTHELPHQWFGSDEDADALAAFHRPKMAGVGGDPRAVEQAVEETRPCAVRRRHPEGRVLTRR